MPRQIVSLYALDLLVRDNHGSVEINEGSVVCHRNGTRYARAFDDTLPEHQLLAARSAAIRRAVADAYPEFFTTIEEQ